MNCSKCNSPIEQGDMFCPQCGAPVQSRQDYQLERMQHTYQPEQRQREYQPVYNKRVVRKSNAGVIVAIVLAIVAVCLTIFAIVMITGNRLANEAEPVTKVEESVYRAPVFEYAVGSTTRSYDVDTAINQKVYYYSDFVMDKDMATAWTPDRNTDPIPSITLYAQEKQKVRGIRMTNGYCKSETTYTKNKRVSRVRVIYSGGETIATFGMDHFREMIDVPFNEIAETDFITVQVLDTYYGEWMDIGISEIEAY